MRNDLKHQELHGLIDNLSTQSGQNAHMIYWCCKQHVLKFIALLIFFHNIETISKTVRQGFLKVSNKFLSYIFSVQLHCEFVAIKVLITRHLVMERSWKVLSFDMPSYVAPMMLMAVEVQLYPCSKFNNQPSMGPWVSTIIGSPTYSLSVQCSNFYQHFICRYQVIVNKSVRSTCNPWPWHLTGHPWPWHSTCYPWPWYWSTVTLTFNLHFNSIPNCRAVIEF